MNTMAHLVMPRVRTLRRALEHMKMQEQVEYLLGIVEQVSWVNGESVHPTDCVDVRSGSQRAILRALHDNLGRTLTYENLWTVISIYAVENSSAPGIDLVKIHVCHIRKRLVVHRWQIKTDWGVGFRMVEVEE